MHVCMYKVSNDFPVSYNFILKPSSTIHSTSFSYYLLHISISCYIRLFEEELEEQREKNIRDPMMEEEGGIKFKSKTRKMVKEGTVSEKKERKYSKVT